MIVTGYFVSAVLFFALCVFEEDCEVELPFVLSLDEELQAAIVSAAVATSKILSVFFIYISFHVL
ncbi:hypothetical protein SGO_0768 [Streptococcus gordonii str. Challis substr. CH1]|uniref:Uncharacterized protein n=1 Tax=Streptococcus gordonii (strain Challis / ATCC 35105 / BCRC 15272 / CH1 / DL1 / V288) TaxID=467705 RepID=A8AWA7_STRGC|nr:hypothetical protein SGO_0768 [Streptococcus gordonii str. Challis substr. CH1]